MEEGICVRLNNKIKIIDMVMKKLRTKEQILYNKRGKPKSVLIDYKVYKEMLELIEDLGCVKIIKERKNEPKIEFERLKDELKKDGIL
ncbi:MAG: hypothetical protein WC557_10430 [Ignavibacteriaceae bacterium]